MNMRNIHKLDQQAQKYNGADIDLMSDPFDTWAAFLDNALGPQCEPLTDTEQRLIAKYGSVENAEYVARRDEWESDNVCDMHD